jgi:DNA-binding winged helix-turn-helix (wHTH) protein/tetratricopeptide (TPR) repeat protein
MSSRTASPLRNYRFDQFELFPNQGSLLKSGLRVPLMPKPLATLVLLVERAGETVLKEELLERVWDGASVEENNLTQSISMLRKVLGEKRGDNRYILTEPGKGYRFVASVSPIEPALAAVFPTPGTAELAEPAPGPGSAFPPGRAEGEVPVDGAGPPVPEAASRRRRAKVLAVRVGSIAACIALGLWLFSFGQGPMASRRSVAVLRIRDLSKASSELWLQTALSEMLTSELSAAGKLRTIPAEDVVRWRSDLGTSEGMGQSALLQSARKTFGADSFVVGSYLVTGACPDCRLRVDLGLYNARTGERSGTVIEEGSAAELLDLTARLGNRLRTELGVGGTASATPRWPATSAMREYAEGVKALELMDPMSARDHLEAAVTADPGNALIHAALADAWTALGYNARASQEYQRAYELSASLGRLDQLGIEGRYRSSIQQWERAIEIYKNVWQLFPDSLEDGLNLARAQMRGGRCPDASATLRRLRLLPGPAGTDPRIDLLEAQNAGAVEDYARTREYAHRAAEQAASRGARYLYARARLLEGGAKLNTGDLNGVALLTEARQRCEEIGDRDCVSKALRIRGNERFFAADFPAAQEAYQNGLAIARELGNRGEIAIILTGLGVVSRSRRDWPQAEQSLKEAASLRVEVGYTPSEVQIQLADLYMEMGRWSDALHILDTAEAAAQAAGAQEDLGEILRMRATLAQSAGDLESAQRSAEKAVDELRPTNGRIALTLALARLSSVVTARGDLKRAESLLSEATGPPIPELAGTVELARAEFLLAGGQFAEANEAAKKSAAAFDKANLDVESTQALMAQADALEMSGKVAEGLAASREAEQRAARTPNQLAIAFVRVAEWRLTTDSSAALPAGLKADVASLRSPELDLWAQFAAAMRARHGGMAGSQRLFHELATAAAKRGYVTLSRRAQALEDAPF